MEKRLKKAKEGIIESAPNIGEVIRGTFRKVYLECIRENCKCHKGKKYRHGPILQDKLWKREKDTYCLHYKG
jgi:hypothetical protein